MGWDLEQAKKSPGAIGPSVCTVTDERAPIGTCYRNESELLRRKMLRHARWWVIPLHNSWEMRCQSGPELCTRRIDYVKGKQKMQVREYGDQWRTAIM